VARIISAKLFIAGAFFFASLYALFNKKISLALGQHRSSCWWNKTHTEGQ
jgi:hypothetical protein